MKKTLLSALFLLTLQVLFAQDTAIDELISENLLHLEEHEVNGFDFRTQIVTEFDVEHASQDVNLKLSDTYTYLVIAQVDSNIPGVDLEIKPSSKAQLTKRDEFESENGVCYELKPLKSGRFKFSINTKGITGSNKGFVSFMVLRK